MKQKQASRANGKRSRGPKSTTRTRFNATKHGLLSASVEAIPEHKQVFHEVRTELEQDLNPQTRLERILIERYAFVYLKLALLERDNLMRAPETIEEQTLYLRYQRQLMLELSRLVRDLQRARDLRSQATEDRGQGTATGGVRGWIVGADGVMGPAIGALTPALSQPQTTPPQRERVETAAAGDQGSVGSCQLSADGGQGSGGTPSGAGRGTAAGGTLEVRRANDPLDGPRDERRLPDDDGIVAWMNGIAVAQGVKACPVDRVVAHLVEVTGASEEGTRKRIVAIVDREHPEGRFRWANRPLEFRARRE